MKIRIPFNKPALTGPELRYISDAVHRGHLSGDGRYTELCQNWLARYLGKGSVLLTPSGTHALELAALLIDLKSGDEVILPTFTFPSTANAFALRGAKLKFVDSRPDTLNMDEEQVEAVSGAKTRAICPVHYGGIVCAMDRIMAAARKHHAVVIEDAAHALGAQLNGKQAGTFGALNAFSFHETKNVTCGEGGALVVTDRRYLARAEIIRQKGTNRAAFYRGEVDKYTWVDIGSSFVPSELQAAFLYAQLQNFKSIQDKRRKLFERYQHTLQGYEDRGIFRLPVLPGSVSSAYHLFYILCESPKVRDRAMLQFRKRGILSIFHYIPLHLSTMGRRAGYKPGMFPVAEQTSSRLLRLPFYSSMSSRDQDTVLNVLREIFG
jgi:dTDP-4-amino-4,6-dideoxygalactose transaminase